MPSHNKKLFINDKQLVDEFIDKYHDLSPVNNLKVNQSEVNIDKVSYEDDIFNILENIEFIDESSDIQFPQVYNLDKFISTGLALFERDLTKYDIEQYTYIRLGVYFDIFESYMRDNEIFYKLNIKGNSIFELDEYNRNIGICHCILEHELFYNIFNVCLEKNEIKSDSIIEIMKNYDLNLNSEETIIRKVNYVSSWMHWIFKLMYPNKNFK